MKSSQNSNHFLTIKPKKIIVYDSTGNYSNQFGRAGNGPGEFKYVLSIVPTTKGILIIDTGKSSVMEYDFRGNFISEIKVKRVAIKKTIETGNNLLSWYSIYSGREGKIIRTRGLGIFTDSLTLIKDIYSVENDFNPYVVDPNTIEALFSLSKSTGDVAVSEIDSREMKIHIFNKDYELIKSLSLNIPPIKYDEKTHNEMQEYYDRGGEARSKRIGKNVKVIELDKYTRLIKDIAYDKDSNLWVTTPQQDDPNKVDVIIFDNNYDLMGKLHTDLPLGKMSIIKDRVMYSSGNKPEETKIIVYEIEEKL